MESGMLFLRAVARPPPLWEEAEELAEEVRELQRRVQQAPGERRPRSAQEPGRAG